MKNKFLQNDKPSNKWLVKDTNKAIIRSVSSKVKNPENLTTAEEMTVKKLIDFVVFSQDEQLNNIKNKDYLTPAVGLAAPQIGVNKDIFYVRFNDTLADTIEEYLMINTKLIAKTPKVSALANGEGCLSVDKNWKGIVPRSYKIVVEGYEWISKKWVSLTLTNYKSIVFQHEMEHNIGLLYYDKINKNQPDFTDKDWILIQ